MNKLLKKKKKEKNRNIEDKCPITENLKNYLRLLRT